MANKFDINSALVKKLADLLDETGLSEIEFESTGRRIRVARSMGGAVPAVAVASPTSAAATPASPVTSNAESSAEQMRGNAYNVADGGDDIPVARTGGGAIYPGGRHDFGRPDRHADRSDENL